MKTTKITTTLMILFFVLLLSLPAVANDAIFNAMKDEMQRSMNELRLENLQKPYFIEYSISVRNSNKIVGAFGEITDKSSDSRASLSVTIRVGDYKFDQKNFFDVGLSFFGSSDEEEIYFDRQIPLELDYNTLRREFWLASDAAYKEAAELYSKKEASLKNKIRRDTLWDFSPQKPINLIDTVAIPKFDFAAGETLISEVSKVFADFKRINTSTATLYFDSEIIYYLNSEGTQYVKNDNLAGIEIAAFTQAEDGMPLSDFYVALADVQADLPSKDSLVKATREIANFLDKSVNATVLEDSYSGPILLLDQAACQAFAQTFLPNLVAQRNNLTSDGIIFGGEERTKAFQTKIGGRVLPEYFSIEDLPNLKEFNKIKLLGDYKIDDEGVLAENVLLVKDGYLKTLLSDRKPIKRINKSNGHNRGGSVMLSNVKIDVAQKYQANESELKKQMLELCKQRDLPYGIVVKKVLDLNIGRTVLYGLSGGGMEYLRGDGSKLQPVEMYKIYPDGKEELIRGGELAGISVAAFKEIIKAGNTNYVLNLLQYPSANAFSGRSLPKQTSIIGQNLLFEDVELRISDKDYKKPPYLQNPLGANGK